MRRLRQESQDLESEFQEKKRIYDATLVGVNTEVSRLEQELKGPDDSDVEPEEEQRPRLRGADIYTNDSLKIVLDKFNKLLAEHLIM